MKTDDKIFVAGSSGLAGSAIVRELSRHGYGSISSPRRAELDLRDQRSVDAFFQRTQPAFVFLAAAKVGGIHANDAFPADFIRDNLQIQTNVIDCAWRHGVSKLCFLGSSCIYPRMAPQPIKEEYLLTGPLEPTNEWYAIAKIAGIKMAQAYRRQYGFNAICLMPTNLYGPGDNFDLENSHVFAALLRRFHEAKMSGAAQLLVWGSGNPRREFLHVDDMAAAAVHMMRHYEGEKIINVGVGHDITIRELAEMIKSVVGFRGAIAFDTSRPDGAPRKLLDVSALSAQGWAPRITLADGIRSTYDWYLKNRT